MSAEPIESAERPRAILLIAAAAIVAGVVAFTTGWLSPLDRALLDAQTERTQRVIDTDAALVEIDAHSLSLNKLGTWPWPRTYHADVIDALVKAGARRIVFDIDFSARSTPAADLRLAEAARNAGGRVVMPEFFQPLSVNSNGYQLIQPIPEILEHVTLGSVNMTPGEGGPVREVGDLTPDGYSGTSPSMAHVLSGRHQDTHRQLIDYRISPRSFPTVSFATVLENPAAAQVLRGRTVFVGATAMEMGDLVAVPVHGSMSGVIVQMIAYETTRGQGLREASRTAGWLAVIFVALASTAIGWRLRWRWLAVFAGAVVLLLAAASALLYAYADLWWAPLPAMFACFTAAAATVLTRLRGESMKALNYFIHIRRQGALLREVVTQSNEAILTRDDLGSILTVNPTARRMLRATDVELVGSPLSKWVPGVAGLSVEEGAPAQCEITLHQAEDEPLVLDVTLTRISMEGERIVSVQMRDITLQKNRERDLRYHATHDALTGLPNRLALTERLAEAFTADGQRKGGALMLMDLDGFKEVNDSLGHAVGDLVLKEIAARFARLLPRRGFVARLGGDEFALVLPCERDSSELQWMCRAFIASASDPVPVRGVPVSLGVSGGMVLWPEHATDAESLLQKADFTLYAAKRRHSGVEMYDPATEPNSPRRLEMLTLLRAAVRHEELYLVYQPKMDLATGRVSGFEALSRWNSPQLGEVSPGEFMPLAEATEIITPLTRWTLERGMSDCAQWRAAGFDVSIAINLSARHLQSSQLVDDVAELLAQTALPPAALELEITESSLMSDPQRAFDILTELRKLGVALSIDDFGTGYSSLSYLQRLQVDRLKIDRSFITDLPRSNGSRAIVASTIQLAHALGLQVIAEGIEEQLQQDILVELGCDYGQGYFYSRGMRREVATDWLRNHLRELEVDAPVISAARQAAADLRQLEGFADRRDASAA